MNSNRSRDLGELKKQAQNYFSLNGDISKRIEDALNSLFYDSPYDVYGYLSEYFVKFSKPLFITKLNAQKSLYYDSKGQTTLVLDIYCHDKNKEMKILSINSPCFSNDLVHDSAKIQLIQEDDAYRASKLNSIITFINTEVNDLVKNFSPLDQEEIDDKLNKLFRSKRDKVYQEYLAGLSPVEKPGSSTSRDDGKKSKTPPSPKQKSNKQTARKSSQVGLTSGSGMLSEELNAHFASCFYGSFVQSLISKAICMCASEISKKPAFEHIAELSMNNSGKYIMPTPLVTLIQNGKGFNGKQTLIKEFILMPKPNLNLAEGVDLIAKVNRFIRDSLYQNKVQPGPVNKCITDNGSFTVTLETAQQGLDMIESAITNSCGAEVGSKLKLAINIGANEIFDQEKNKYEIAVGALKSSDELVDVYVDLIAKYPRIAMIIDPFNKNEPLSWYKLYSRVSKTCLIANSLKINDLAEANMSSSNDDNVDDEIKNIEKLDSANNKIPPDQSKIPESLKPTPTIIMPVSLFKFENSANLTSLISKIKENDEKKLYHGLACGPNESEDGFLSDLAVGNQVSFIKIGGFQRSERIKKINRLIEIESYLKENNLLLNAKERSEDFYMPTDLDIPNEFSEALQSYQTNIEEAKHKTTKK